MFYLLHLFLNHPHKEEPPKYKIIDVLAGEGKPFEFMTREAIDACLKTRCGHFWFHRKENMFHVIAYVVCKDSGGGPCTLKIMDSFNPSQFGSYPIEPTEEPSEQQAPFTECEENDPLWYFEDQSWKPGWCVSSTFSHVLRVKTVQDNEIRVKLSHLRRRFPLGIRLHLVVGIVSGSERPSSECE